MPKTVSETPGCIGCPLARLYPSNTFVQPKLGTGDRLVIAEAPGLDETFTGEPLTGGAGTWFNIISGKAGLKRDELTLCNVIQCRPKDNIFPTDPDAATYISPLDGVEAVEHCLKTHVLPLLKSKKWKRIDLLGAKALEWLTGRSGGIFRWRGSIMEIDTDEIESRIG